MWHYHIPVHAEWKLISVTQLDECSSRCVLTDPLYVPLIVVWFLARSWEKYFPRTINPAEPCVTILFMLSVTNNVAA